MLWNSLCDAIGMKPKDLTIGMFEMTPGSPYSNTDTFQVLGEYPM